VHANQITQWKSELMGRATEIFATAAERKEAANVPDVGSLHAKIGQQAMEIDFLEVALGRMDGASAKK
jgi:transposase